MWSRHLPEAVPDLGYWSFVIPGPGAVPRIIITRSIPNNDVAAGKLGRMMCKVYTLLTVMDKKVVLLASRDAVMWRVFRSFEALLRCKTPTLY
jgi:hypothetical protein